MTADSVLSLKVFIFKSISKTKGKQKLGLLQIHDFLLRKKKNIMVKRTPLGVQHSTTTQLQMGFLAAVTCKRNRAPLLCVNWDVTEIKL